MDSAQEEAGKRKSPTNLAKTWRTTRCLQAACALPTRCALACSARAVGRHPHGSSARRIRLLREKRRTSLVLPERWPAPSPRSSLAGSQPALWCCPQDSPNGRQAESFNDFVGFRQNRCHRQCFPAVQHFRVLPPFSFLLTPLPVWLSSPYIWHRYTPPLASPPWPCASANASCFRSSKPGRTTPAPPSSSAPPRWTRTRRTC